MQKPEVKPNHPFFSSGPCSKRPGWNLEALNNAFLGRSHRAKNGKAKLLKEPFDVRSRYDEIKKQQMFYLISSCFLLIYLLSDCKPIILNGLSSEDQSQRSKR